MTDRILTSTVFLALAAAFGGFGVHALIKAYRATEHVAWVEQATLGSVGILAGAYFAKLALELLP